MENKQILRYIFVIAIFALISFGSWQYMASGNEQPKDTKEQAETLEEIDVQNMIDERVRLYFEKNAHLFKGDQGEIGPRGPQGEQGAQGPAGEDGEDGKTIVKETIIKEELPDGYFQVYCIRAGHVVGYDGGDRGCQEQKDQVIYLYQRK